MKEKIRKVTEDEKILKHLKENGSLSREQIAQDLGMGLQRVRERASVMKKQKLVKEIRVLVPINSTVSIEVR